jgi:hypothetical protein
MIRDIMVRIIAGVLIVLLLYWIGHMLGIALVSGLALRSVAKSRR